MRISDWSSDVCSADLNQDCVGPLLCEQRVGGDDDIADRLCRSRTGGVAIAVRRANGEIAEEVFIEFEIIVLAGMDKAVVLEPVELLDRQRPAEPPGPSAQERTPPEHGAGNS